MRRLYAALYLLLAAPACFAQGTPHLQLAPPDPAFPRQDSSLTGVSLPQFQAQLLQMQALLAACRVQPILCDPNAVPPDEELRPEELRPEQLQPASQPISQTASPARYTVRWYWLRETLNQTRGGKPGAAPDQDRQHLLAQASDRLEEEARDAASPNRPAIVDERRQADAILSRAEFRRVQHAGYLQQKLAQLSLFLDRLFSGATALIPQSPWFATLLEWAILGVAAAALILWARRVSKQQRLVVVAHHQSSAAPWQQESEDWADQARAEAQRGHWREAIHSLYWSAIILLEGQKLWRQNRARTPREYVLLLDPASDRRAALLSLTRILERIWYGLRTASEDDYRQATEILDRLRLA